MKNYYDKKFEKMLEDAKENGYKFENGKFVKNTNDFIT